jgi:hypothetical protein
MPARRSGGKNNSTCHFLLTKGNPRDCQENRDEVGNASLKRGLKPIGLTPPQTGLPKTLESGFIENLMGHAPSRRIVFSKFLFSIWVN